MTDSFFVRRTQLLVEISPPWLRRRVREWESCDPWRPYARFYPVWNLCMHWGSATAASAPRILTYLPMVRYRYKTLRWLIIDRLQRWRDLASPVGPYRTWHLKWRAEMSRTYHILLICGRWECCYFGCWPGRNHLKKILRTRCAGVSEVQTRASYFHVRIWDVAVPVVGLQSVYCNRIGQIAWWRPRPSINVMT